MKTALPGSEELLEKLLAHLGPKWLPRLIGIDGDDGVGKSSLASWLAMAIGRSNGASRPIPDQR